MKASINFLITFLSSSSIVSRSCLYDGDKFTYSTSELADLDKDESDIFSAFPAKMKQFNKAFRESRIVDDQAYYIFLIKGTGHQYAGFMPFKRKFGYIFLNNTQNISNTIAHELGHGAFRLKHNFSEFEGKVTQGSTDNLMDYNNGTVLKKYQWDQISDPAMRLAWLEDDEEGAMVSLATLDVGAFVDPLDPHILQKIQENISAINVNMQNAPAKFMNWKMIIPAKLSHHSGAK